MNTYKPRSLAQYIKEVGEWAGRNFPNNQPWQPLIGIGEELFVEFTNAIDADNNEDSVDSLCDSFIFLCNFMSLVGIEDKKLLKSVQIRHISYDYGCLLKTYLKYSQGIRDINLDNVKDACTELYHCMDRFASEFGEGMTILVLAEPIWEKVKQRDWITYPKNGMTE